MGAKKRLMPVQLPQQRQQKENKQQKQQRQQKQQASQPTQPQAPVQAQPEPEQQPSQSITSTTTNLVAYGEEQPPQIKQVVGMQLQQAQPSQQQPLCGLPFTSQATYSVHQSARQGHEQRQLRAGQRSLAFRGTLKGDVVWIITLRRMHGMIQKREGGEDFNLNHAFPLDPPMVVDRHFESPHTGHGVLQPWECKVPTKRAHALIASEDAGDWTCPDPLWQRQLDAKFCCRARWAYNRPMVKPAGDNGVVDNRCVVWVLMLQSALIEALCGAGRSHQLTIQVNGNVRLHVACYTSATRTGDRHHLQRQHTITLDGSRTGGAPLKGKYAKPVLLLATCICSWEGDPAEIAKVPGHNQTLGLVYNEATDMYNFASLGKAISLKYQKPKHFEGVQEFCAVSA